MFARWFSPSNLRHPLVAIAGVLLALAVVAPLAYAKLAANTIDPVGTLSHNGRRIAMTGPFTCDQIQPVTMRVTVTQRSTGAIAEGHALIVGTTSQQQWRIVVQATGNAAFEPGPATAVAVARTFVFPWQPDDAHQWLVNVTLVEP